MFPNFQYSNHAFMLFTYAGQSGEKAYLDSTISFLDTIYTKMSTSNLAFNEVAIIYAMPLARANLFERSA